MKFSKYISVILVLLFIGNLNVSVLADNTLMQLDDATVTNGCHSLDAMSAYLGSEKLADNVGAAVLYEMNSDTLMYAWHADKKVYPSSMVKILTALIAVEKGDPQTVITVTQDVLDSVPYYAASAELQVDEQIPLSDLLYCMMVGSANDAAAVIASHISGSQDSFVKEMNDYALALGCTGTQFTNVHGLHDEQQYTTARDMARILSAAVRNEAFLAYFSAVNYIVPATNKSEERELSSGNFLVNTEDFQLYYDPRVTGGRTGITEDGARCLATVAQHNGMQLISVVTGSESTFADDGSTLTYGSFKETTTLLDACFNGYQVAQVLYKGQVLKQSSIPDGENDVVLCSEESVYAVLPEDVSVADLTFKYGDTALAAPVEAGQVLSDVEIWHGGFCIARSDLKAMNSVRKVAVGNAVDGQGESNGGLKAAVTILAWVIGGVLGVLVLIRGVRILRVYLLRRRGKAYRRNRRRSR